MRVKLSKVILASAKPGPSHYLLRDTRTVGLALEVEPSGTRTFVFEYRVPGKPSQRYNIGRYREPWTLDQASAGSCRVIAGASRHSEESAVLSREGALSRCFLYSLV